ncbi:MAG: hypothetical protein J6S34_01940, partial [Clostridia bacterium]|nr:hypothetical protein [Clostridia bacterium]
MKRTLALLLVIAMLACSIPAFALVSFAEGENTDGLNAKIYQLKALPDVMPYTNDRYFDIVGTTSGEGPRCSFDDTVRFENALPTLLYTSKIDPAHNGTGLTGLDGIFGADGYFMKWEGTVTAATTGDYTMVGRKIDNGFLAFVDQNGDGAFTSDEKFFDYASPNHWFDGGEDRLVSQQGAFHLEAGVATAIQMWYYEAGGGEACQIHVSTEGGANDKSFGDAGLTFNLDRTAYTSNLAVNHDRINAHLPAGITANGEVAWDNNGCQADNPGNHNYKSTIDSLMTDMFLVEEKVLPTFETSGFGGLGYCGFEYEDSLIDYTGYITPAFSGIYQFGTTKVDNCLFIEIQIDGEWVTAYEFWAKFIWNDNGTTYYNYNEDLVLEAGKSYPIHVSFLEINGGEAIELVTKINGGVEYTFSASGLKLTTEPYNKIPEVKTQYFFNTRTEWKYMTSGEGNTVTDAPANWITDPAVSANWATGTAPMMDEWGAGDPPTNHQKLWLTKTFDVENLDIIADWAVMTKMHYDDNMNIYINGKKVYFHGGWNDGYPTYKLALKASDVLVEGTNIIAISLVQGFGGYDYDGDLYVTKEDTASYLPNYIEISTADQLVAYANYVNALPNQNATRETTVVLTADINMAGKAWNPINRFLGTFDGQGYTISNLSYTATGTKSNVGAFVIDIANDGVNGRVKNIVFDNCTLTVATDNNNAYAAIVAAKADRGNLTNITVKNSQLLGNAMKAAAIVAEACWGIGDGHVIDCTVEDTLIVATQKTAALVGRVTGGDDVVIRNNTVKNVSYINNSFNEYVVDDNGKAVITETTIADIKVLNTLAPSEDSDYAFYYQTRDGVDGKKDYRI